MGQRWALRAGIDAPLKLAGGEDNIQASDETVQKTKYAVGAKKASLPELSDKVLDYQKDGFGRQGRCIHAGCPPVIDDVICCVLSFFLRLLLLSHLLFMRLYLVPDVLLKRSFHLAVIHIIE